MKKMLFLTAFLVSIVMADNYLGFGPAMSSGSDNMNYWFCGGKYFHRGSFDTKVKLDCATDFQESIFLAGTIGFNYYFIKDFLLAGFDFGFGSDFDDYGFIGGASLGIAVASRTFLIEPSIQTVLKEDFPFIAGLKVGILFGKDE
jgi:hypothetical protein